MEAPSALAFDTATIGRLTREWVEVLERDAATPSIAAQSANELLERYEDLVAALLDSPVVITGFCYTQLTDTGAERAARRTSHPQGRPGRPRAHQPTTIGVGAR